MIIIVLIIPPLITLSSIIYALYKKIIKKQPTSLERIVSGISLYVTILTIQISVFEDQLSSDLIIFENNLSKYLNIDFHHTEIKSDTEIIDRFIKVCEQINIDKNGSIKRIINAPSPLPGNYYENDRILANYCISKSIPVEYLIGCDWSATEPQETSQYWQQRYILKYLVEMLSFEGWNEYDKLAFSNLTIFHVRSASTHESFNIKGKDGELGGMIFLQGDWNKNEFAKRTNFFYTSKQNIHNSINDEITFTQKIAIEHLKQEMDSNKKPWDRCLCTIFCDQNYENGMRMCSIEEVEKKINEIEARFVYEMGKQKSLPYQILLLKKVINDIK